MPENIPIKFQEIPEHEIPEIVDACAPELGQVMREVGIRRPLRIMWLRRTEGPNVFHGLFFGQYPDILFVPIDPDDPLDEIIETVRHEAGHAAGLDEDACRALERRPM